MSDAGLIDMLGDLRRLRAVVAAVEAHVQVAFDASVRGAALASGARRQDAGKGIAEQVALDHADVNLVALPPGLTAVTAAGLGCRFATAYRALTVHGRPSAGDWVAVHGCGGVGLSAVMVGASLGARVLESNFGRPTCYGRACIGRGSAGYNEIMLTLLLVGFAAALRTGIAGPGRWRGLIGIALVAVSLFAQSFQLRFAAIERLWP